MRLSAGQVRHLQGMVSGNGDIGEINYLYFTIITTPVPSKVKYNYLPELKAFLSGRAKPAMVTVNLTGRCNQHCIYCEIGQEIPSTVKDSLTVTDMFWILDEMDLAGIRRISLCGGEPFLFEGIADVISYAASKRIRCSITSNGMTVYRLKDSDFEILRKNKADINLSVDSFEEPLQALIRGTPSALSNALRSIDKLRDEKIPVTILSTISRHNFRELSSIVETAYRIGIKQVLFQPVIHYTNYPDRRTIDRKADLNVPGDDIGDLMDQLNQILRFEHKHDVRTNVYRIRPWIRAYLEQAASPDGKMFFEEVLRVFYCREIDAAIDITYDGGIQPCGLTRSTVNIHEQKGRGLIELWQEATMRIRADLSHKNYYEYCNACCHKFSRNMMASMMKFPYRNRVAVAGFVPLVLARIGSRTMKRIVYSH